MSKFKNFQMSFIKMDKDIFEDLVTIYSDCDDKNCDSISNEKVQNDNTDDDLYEFYYKVLYDLLDAKQKKNVNYFRLYGKLLRQSSNSWCKLDKNASLDLRHSLFYLISQLYRNGPIVSSAVACFFEKSADFDSNILNGLLDKSEINICSFGGFPADIVGIVHKLCCAAEDKRCDLKLNVTILDINDEWKDVCISTLLHLKPFHSSIEKITYLSKKKIFFYDDVIIALRKADIISMVMYFSKSHKARNSINSVMSNVCELSKSGCMILVLDSPSDSFVEQFGGYSGKCLHKYCHPICDNIFGLHTLKDSVLQKHNDLYKYLCNGALPNYYMKYFLRIWVKSLFRLPSIKELNSEGKKLDLEMWFEMNKFNPIVLNFHLQIEKLKSERENMKKITQKLTERRDFLKLKYDLVQERKEKFLYNLEIEAKKKKNKKSKNKLQNTQMKTHKYSASMSTQYAIQEYQVAEEELATQKQKQEAVELCFDSKKENLYQLAWKAYRENERALVHAELQNYRCSIIGSLK